MTTKTVHLAVYDTLADWEVGAATAHINNPEWHREPGTFRVVTVGISKDPITTMGGMRILPDVVLAELRPQDSVMLILPGGNNWFGDAGTPFAKKAREFLAAGVPVAAICGATLGLAQEGLLDERAHTSNDPAFLEASGYTGAAHYQAEPAVTDGDLITGSGIAPMEFAREVLARLDVYEPGTLDAWYRLFGQQDPSGFYELTGA